MTYNSSLNAEFAKEAMSNQSLNNNEVRNNNDCDLCFIYYIN